MQKKKEEGLVVGRDGDLLVIDPIALPVLMVAMLLLKERQHVIVLEEDTWEVSVVGRVFDRITGRASDETWKR